MSKQLALSIALSVMAMTALAVIGSGRTAMLASGQGLSLPLSAKTPMLPSVSHLIPALQ
ncbi:hypothetical protein B0I00_1310 [Novosphingobium kunmingense]|uniref:Uncharacterized protein n=1 Tax=Novosphingobium kunmingense TaxID=1211806 RepID=A0A2N0HJG7_9SPHN|nr:hypothetical protein [Novosphingobium kunmingense]PKB19082.1 hypothetical protein B0I00_1310 [Novosphingobium kunmingense]